MRHLNTIIGCLIAAFQLTAAPLYVSIEGNFGSPSGGSSWLDHQDYVLTYSIPNPGAPDLNSPPDRITYLVPVTLSVPSIGVIGSHAGQVAYFSGSTSAITIFGITGVPTPSDPFMILFLGAPTPVWNGNVGSPVIFPLSDVTAGTDWVLACGSGPPGSCSQDNPVVQIRYFGSATLSVTEAPAQVSIDIQPGSQPNSVNCRQNGVIPVAILSTTTSAGEAVTFDATTVDSSTVRFGPAAAMRTHHKAHFEDVDHDGDLDMLLHFRRDTTGIQCGDQDACLTGQTTDGTPIQGCDAIRTVGG